MKLARLNDGPEIFHTIQGEGVSAGTPAVFVRTSRCNLHCVWCDTDHTWNFEGTPWKHEKGRKHGKTAATFETSPADVAERVTGFACSRVVLTGGEPLLQQPELTETVHLIRQRIPDCIVEVETNGTLIPNPAFESIVNQFNVSPKLSNSQVPDTLRIKEDALQHFASLTKAWFKFVITSQDDLDEAAALCEKHSIPTDHTLLMPEGRTSADLDRTAAWLADCCRERNLRFSDRLHIRLWGDKRGV